MKRWILLPLLVALLGSASPASAAGFIVVDEANWWPGPTPPYPPHPLPPPWPPRPIPMPPRHYAFAPVEVRQVNVTTRINDQVAVTSIDQEFYNSNPAR